MDKEKNIICRKYNINNGQVKRLYKDNPNVFCADFLNVSPAFVSIDVNRLRTYLRIMLCSIKVSRAIV